RAHEGRKDHRDEDRRAQEPLEREQEPVRDERERHRDQKGERGPGAGQEEGIAKPRQVSGVGEERAGEREGEPPVRVDEAAAQDLQDRPEEENREERGGDEKHDSGRGLGHGGGAGSAERPDFEEGQEEHGRHRVADRRDRAGAPEADPQEDRADEPDPDPLGDAEGERYREDRQDGRRGRLEVAHVDLHDRLHHEDPDDHEGRRRRARRDREDERREEEGEEHEDGHPDRREAGPPARLDPGRRLDVADDRGGAAEGRQDRRDRVGEQRAPGVGEAALLVEQARALGDADQRADVVEHVDEQQREDEGKRGLEPRPARQEAERQLEEDGRGRVGKREDARPQVGDTAAGAVGDKEPGEGYRQDAENDRAPHAARDQERDQDDPGEAEGGGAGREVARADEGGGVGDDDPPALEPYERDEEPDAAGHRELQAERDRRDDLLADPGHRQGQEDDPVDEDHPERLAPRQPLAEAYRVREEGVYPHAGRHGYR